MSNVIDFSKFKKNSDLKKNQAEIRVDDNQRVMKEYGIKSDFGALPEVDLGERISKVKHSLERINQLMQELRDGKK
jgi:hypothetical protein